LAYVEKLKIDLDRLAGPVTLFEGTARDGVPHFPANVNIAAVLSLAGVGFERTRLKVVADPALRFNTHSITIRGKTGTMSLRFESVPSPTIQDCDARLLQRARRVQAVQLAVRYGT